MTIIKVSEDNFQIGNSVLTDRERKQYETEGYIVRKNCVPKYEIDRYYKRFEDICRGRVHVPTMTVMKDISILKEEFEGEKNITKIQDFNEDEVLFSYCCYPKVLDVVKDLIGNGSRNPTILSMHTMLINKPPDSGKLTSRHPMHQDLNYFPFRPPFGICCAWTAMEKINRANGCLVVIPGSHKGQLLKHSYPKWEGGVNKAYHGIQDYDPSIPKVYVEMECGDTVFFHPLLIHGSGANRTNGFRKAISCHYANDSVCRYVDVKGTIQEHVEKEIIEMAKKKFAKKGMTDVEITFQDIWSIRARTVCGKRSHL
uniref:phytanoyl-CoA dioxygenase n=1 Tax=Strongyloides venezuelensis TaxID=75913 RepID=A0A0K0G0P4_STRVS